MNQFLPRGYQVSSGNRIRKMVANGSIWQIYLTNVDSYVLAINLELYNIWAKAFSLPESLFFDSVSGEYKVLVSNHGYIISSLEYGPFPDSNEQIEAFSITFKTSVDLYKDADFHNAIYIEEYSLLLPTSFDKAVIDNGLVYGKWITGGIGISIDSSDRIFKIMNWLPKESIIYSAQLAGFDLLNKEEENVDVVKPSEKEIKQGVDNMLESSSDYSKPFQLIGRPDLEEFFNDNIIDIVLHQEKYKRMGIPFPGATVLYGPPGCGKTYAVEKLSEYLGWERFDIDSSTIASSYIHDTSKKISELFQAAIDAAPSIIVIDEMEAFLSDRGKAGSLGTHHIEEVAEFLRRIPEAISKGVLVFAMTNLIDTIDPAILRRGRFDHIVEVKMPHADEIEMLLRDKFKDLPIDDTVQPRLIADKLAGHPMSDVTFVLREAGRIAVKNEMEYMSQDCFENAINMLPKKKEQRTIGFFSN